MDRPGLAALLDYARAGDTLAVVRLDRLGRSLAELLATVAMLKERGIALVSLEERIDTSSAAGELVFHVFGAIGHFERRLIAERTRDGIAAARARGGGRSAGTRSRPRSSWWPPACRLPRRRGSSASDGPPSTGKSAAQVSGEARGRPARLDHRTFCLRWLVENRSMLSDIFYYSTHS